MVGFVLGLVKGWKLWVALALIGVIVAGVHSYNSAIADAVREKERADAWQNASVEWKKAYQRSETLRKQEAGQAVSSASREREQCNQRVARSLQSASAIRSVVRVREVPAPCDAGDVIGTNELRDALN